MSMNRKDRRHDIMSRLSSLLILLGAQQLAACGHELKPSNKRASNRQTESAENASQASDADSINCVIPAASSGTNAAAVSYALDIQPILSSKCVSCHAIAAPAMATEADAKANATIIANAVSRGTMPPNGPLSSAEVAKISTWAQAGTSLSLAPATPTWYGEIQPFINGKCAYCHNTGGESPNLTTLNGVKNKASELLSKMKTTGEEKMPPSDAAVQLVAGDAAMFQAWMSGGYALGTPPAPIDTNKPIYYDATIRDLLAANCTSCHTPGVVGPDLSTYAAAKAAGPLLVSDIVTKKMPKSGPLSAEAIAAFQKWESNGFPLDANSSIFVGPPVVSGDASSSNGSESSSAAGPCAGL